MEYSFKHFIEEKYSEILISSVKKFLCQMQMECNIVSVCDVSVDSIDYTPLQYAKDFVTLHIVLKCGLQTEQDGALYYNTIRMSAILSGSFSQDFQDIQVVCSELLKGEKKYYPAKYTDDLLPIMDKNQIEKSAMDLLERVYPYKETQPGVIAPEWIAYKLNIPVYYETLSPNHSIRGEYIYKDSYRTIYHEKSGEYRSVWLKKGSILLEKSLKNKPEICRFTLMHELCHAVLHRFALELYRMYDTKGTTLFCPAMIESKEIYEDSFIEKIERHADMIASSALMPEMQFRTMAERFRKNQQNADSYKKQLEETAEFFMVSLSACKRRYLMLGFEQMRGIFVFVDGKYIRPYCFRGATLSKQQVITLSVRQAKEAILQQPKLLKMLSRNLVYFVENHFILNDSRYLTKDKNLTTYARNHMEECAFVFHLEHSKSHYALQRMDLLYDGIFRVSESSEPLHVYYADENRSLEERARQLYKRNEDVRNILEDLPESFAKALKIVQSWTGLTEEEFAYRSGISVKTLQRLERGETTNPTPQILLKICMGNKLPMELSFRLFQKSGNELRTSKQDMAYMQLLMFSGYYNLEQCNHILTQQGLKTFSITES